MSEHGPDWSDWGIDHPEEGPSCKCGFNGSPEECAEVRSTDTTDEGDDLPAPCSEECGWCGENMPRDTTGSAEQ